MSKDNSWTENINMLAPQCHIQKYEEMDLRESVNKELGKWINGLNQMMRESNNTAEIENGLTDMMRGGTMRGGTNDSAAARMIGAWNDTAAVDNGLIHETVDPSHNKTTDKS